MTTVLAVVQQFHNTLDLPERDRGAASAAAAGLRDAKAGNTRRAYRSAWRQFRTWAEACGHPALPAAPQAVVLFWATWPQPAGPSPPFSRHAPPSPTFTPPPGRGRATTRPCTRWCPRRSRGGATGAPAPRQAGALAADRPDPGPRGPAPAQERPRRTNGGQRTPPGGVPPSIWPSSGCWPTAG